METEALLTSAGGRPGFQGPTPQVHEPVSGSDRAAVIFCGGATCPASQSSSLRSPQRPRQPPNDSIPCPHRSPRVLLLLLSLAIPAAASPITVGAGQSIVVSFGTMPTNWDPTDPPDYL